MHHIRSRKQKIDLSVTIVGDLMIQVNVVRGRRYALDVARRVTRLKPDLRVEKGIRPSRRVIVMVVGKRAPG